MTTLQDVLSLSMLSGFIWAAGFGVPKALREGNWFGASCSLLAGGVALIGWLLLAAPTHSMILTVGSPRLETTLTKTCPVQSSLCQLSRSISAGSTSDARRAGT
jgi:hypothetical protein